jgi:hypothetical protein
MCVKADRTADTQLYLRNPQSGNEHVIKLLP